MFTKNSRYEKVSEYVAKDSSGNYNKVKKIRFIPKTDSSMVYTIKQNDRLDLISYQFYGDPTKFWLICDANKEMYPDNLLKRGNVIFIPSEPF